MREFSLAAVYATNFLGIMMILTALAGRFLRFRFNDKLRPLETMSVMALVSCVVDPLVFTLDGHGGAIARLIILLGNSWLYLANAILAFYWLVFLTGYLDIKLSKVHRGLLTGSAAVAVLMIVGNFFMPLAFSVDAQNVYRRERYYWVLVMIFIGYILDSLLVYVQVKRKGGSLKFFPVWIFILPVMIGAVVQALFYGISIVWACVSIAIVGVMLCLQSERVFRDQLTGLYNRYYLDDLKREMEHVTNNRFTGLMLDLNGFKSINDTCGHQEGDNALRLTAGLLREAVGSVGTVIRYAGDEFIVILNTQEDTEIERCINAIRDRFARYNHEEKKPYTLSVSIGCTKFDLKTQTVDQLINEMDARMYENKRLFYQSNRGFDRRKR